MGVTPAVLYKTKTRKTNFCLAYSFIHGKFWIQILIMISLYNSNLKVDMTLTIKSIFLLDVSYKSKKKEDKEYQE